MSNTSRTSWLLSQEMPFEEPFSSCELMSAGCLMMMLGMLLFAICSPSAPAATRSDCGRRSGDGERGHLPRGDNPSQIGKGCSTRRSRPGPLPPPGFPRGAGARGVLRVPTPPSPAPQRPARNSYARPSRLGEVAGPSLRASPIFRYAGEPTWRSRHGGSIKGAPFLGSSLLGLRPRRLILVPFLSGGGNGWVHRLS